MALDSSVLAREQKRVLLLASSMTPSCSINVSDINTVCILLSMFEGILSSSDKDQVSEISKYKDLHHLPFNFYFILKK